MSDKEKDGINVTEYLIGIKEDIAGINSKIDRFNETTDKADKALGLSRENQRNIKKLENLVNNIMYGVVVVGGTALVVYVIEKMIGG